MLVFYGFHCEEWNNRLNDSLLPAFKTHQHLINRNITNTTNIASIIPNKVTYPNDITNCTTIQSLVRCLREIHMNKVKNDVVIVPLMEIHMLELYDNMDLLMGARVVSTLESIVDSIVNSIVDSTVDSTVESNVVATVRSTIIMPTRDTIQTFMNKKHFYEYMIKHDLSQYVPKTYCNINTDILNHSSVIVKPFQLNYGAGMYVCNPHKISPTIYNNCIIQEYIDDPVEYVSHVVAKGGVIKCCITYKYTFSQTNHISSQRHQYKTLEKVSISDNAFVGIDLINTIESILKPCEYTGFMNVDYKIDNSGKPIIKIFEVNPRLGGSLMHSKNKPDLITILTTMIGSKKV